MWLKNIIWKGYLKDWAYPCVSERRATHGHTQSSQQSQKWLWRYPGKNWKSLLSNDVGPMTYTEDPHGFWESCITRHCTLRWKGKEAWIERRVSGLQNCPGRTQMTEVLSFKHVLSFKKKEKKNKSWGTLLFPEREATHAKAVAGISRGQRVTQKERVDHWVMAYYSHAWNLLEFVLLDLQHAWDPWPLYCSRFYSFGMGTYMTTLQLSVTPLHFETR